MAKKAFEIQGSDLKLGGVSLQAGTTGVVIPGVTQAANYRVEEVEDVDDQTYSNFPAESEVVVVDAALYNAIVNDLNEDHFADYTATTDDDGEIDEIEVNGRGTYTQQEANTASGNDMYAYVGSSNASDRPLIPEDWIQIPFRPKMRAGEVENVGGGSGSGSSLTDSDWELALSEGRVTLIDDNGDDHSLWMARGDQLLLDGLGGDVVLSANDNVEWEFGTNGSLTFPDGTIQTTAYTGQSGGGSSASTLYVAVNNDGRAFTSANGLSWTEYSTTMNEVGRVAVGPDMIVYTATAVDASNGEEESLWYATTSAPGTVTEVTGFSDFTLNQVKYFANIEKFVAIGNNSINLPVILYSSNGVNWTQVDLDNGFLAAFDSGAGFQGNAEFTDIETNGTGFLLTTSNNNLGAFYTTDITTSMGQANWIDFSGFGLEWGFNRIAFAAAGGFYGWHIMQNESDTDDAWYYNNNTNPTSGTFSAFVLNDIGGEFAVEVNYQPQVSEVVFGAYNGITTIMIATDDGQILYWPAIEDGPFVSIPKPYTATDFDITQSSTATITFGNKSAIVNEKIVLTNCTPSEYNGTYYVDNNNFLYTNANMGTAFDSSGLGSFESGTLTFSHGQYIDALHYSNGVFYAGNDDEEMFVSTNGGATWNQTTAFDGSPGEPEYMNDIDSYVVSGVNTGDVTFSTNVVEGSGWELGLSPGPDFTTGAYTSDNDGPDLGPQYFRVRGGDNPTHLHFDTTDNNEFDLYIGDDDTYFKLSKDGQAVIGTEARTEPYDNHTWTFGIDGTLTFPDGTIQTSGLSPELSKSDSGTLIANAPIQFGESNQGMIVVLDSEGGDNSDQWFNSVVGDSDGILYACGTNDDGPQYVWAFNADGSLKWKIGIDDIYGNSNPRTMTLDGSQLVIGISSYNNETDSREMAVLKLNTSDGSVNSSYTLSTNTVGNKIIRDIDVDGSGNHIVVGYLNGEYVSENNIAPIKTAWGSNVNVLVVANSSLSTPVEPWNSNIEIQNDPLNANSWTGPDSVNWFRDLPVTVVTGTGGPQNYNIDDNYALGKLQLVVGDSGTTTILRLDATWVDGAAQTHLLAQTGTYSYTIVCSPGTYVAGQTTSWVDIGGGIYEAGLSVSGIISDGTYDVTSLTINKSVMTAELRYVPQGLNNSGFTGGMIDAYNVQQSGQGYAAGDVVKVLGSQMGGIDTITLSGAPLVYGTNENIYFSSITYPEMSQVQNGWRISGPGITGWATLFNVQDTGGAYRFDIAPGSTITSGETYTIDNNGNDIILTLADWGGGPYINFVDGKVSDQVAATTRFIMGQGVDYRGTENTTTYSAGTEYTAGQVHASSTGGGAPVLTDSTLSQSFTNGALVVTPDGLTVYSSTGADIYVATLASAWDLTSWTPGTTYTIPFNMMINHTGTLAFNADGTKIIKVVSDGGYFVATYNLSTAYDVSSLTGSVTKSTSALGNLPSGTPTDIKFANGGMIGYIFTSDGKVAQYNLVSAYDIDSFSGDPDGTADLTTLFSLNFFGKPKGFTLNAEGTIGYVTDSGASYSGGLTQFSLATPFDITTIQTPALATVSGFGGNAGWHGVAINTDGTRLFFVGPNSGSTATIFQYNAAVAPYSYYVTVNPTLTLINSELTLGKEIVLTAGVSNATVTILDVLGTNGDGDYEYEVSDASSLGSNSVDIDSIEIPNGTYTGTWNLRTLLDSQAFIRTNSWEHTYGNNQYQQFYSVAYDSFDNSVYAYGEFYNGDNTGALFKFEYDTGNIIWIKYVEDDTGTIDEIGSVVVDGTGNVYVCAGNDNSDTIVTKLTSTGSLVWQVRQEDTNSWENNATCVLDSNGDIIIGGSYYNSDDPVNDHNVWSFMKLSKTDGSLIWARYLDNQEKYGMYDMYDYDNDVMTVQGDNIFFGGYAMDSNDTRPVALAFKFNTNGGGMGTYGRWVYTTDPNASWIDNTSNAVVIDGSGADSVEESDQTVFTSSTGNVTVTVDDVGSLTANSYILGIEGKLVFVDESELTTAGIARHSVDSGDNSIWLTASMNGKFRYYANNPGGLNSTIYIPTNANTPLPIGFTLTVVMGDFNGSRVYVNNDDNSDVQILVSGNDNFGVNYWQFNANTNAAGVYTIMKVDTDTWMLAGPDITID